MQRILDLIEATLDAEMTPAELAEASGYSHWHFLHLFREAVGMPLCRYRNRRRLAHAIWHVQQGMPVTDAALRWGFGTHSGFYRAFQREYGCSPAVFLRTHQVRRPSVPRLNEEEHPMLNRDAFREALSHWKLGHLPLTPVTYPASGAVNEHAMYAGETYVLKACRDAHGCRMNAEIAAALAAQDVPAAVAVPLPDGRLSLPVVGMEMMLCRRIPGHPLRTPELLRTPETSGLRVGQALAELARVLQRLPEMPFADDLDYPTHLLEWALPQARDYLPEGFPTDFADRVRAMGELPRGIVHRDPNPGNLIGTDDGVGFIDFDMSVRTVRIFDPCYTATAVLSESYGRVEGWEESWPVFVRALLKGYDSVLPLSEEEWKAAPILMLGNELLVLAAFADSTKYREVFETNRQMLSWMLKHMLV